MRRRVPLLIGIAATLAIGAAVVFGVAGWDTGDESRDLTRYEFAAGQRPEAPPIAGQTLDDEPLDLADLRGDVVVVNVWGSWCGPCRAEMPELEAAYQATRELGVSFVGVNIRDSRDKARSFAAARVTYPSIFDPGSEYALGFSDPPAPLGPPATLVIDRDGYVASAVYRVIDAAELEQLITQVASEDDPAEAGDG